MTFNGSFTYSGGTNAYGTVSSINFSVSNSTVFTVTGMTVGNDMHTMQGYAATTGDTQQTYAYVLKGNDTIKGSSGADTIIGYGGNDMLYGNAGADKLYGYAGADTLYGGIGNDTLIGAIGADKLIGGGGKDILIGGTESDIFIFNAPLGSTNIDTIKDYTKIDDSIRLENSIFTKLSTTGVLNAANFKVGTAAGDTNDYIIYDNTTGKLYYDADGNGGGAKVLVANVFSSGTSPASLSAGEFVVI